MEITQKISVVIICTDQEDFLDETLRSLESQTYPIHEIIIVTSGSINSNTSSIIRKLDKTGAIEQATFSNHLIQIIIVNQESHKPSQAKNSGIYNSTGDYIQFLNSTDSLHEDKFRLQISSLTQNPEIDVVISDFIITDKVKSNHFKKLETTTWLTDAPLEDFLFRWETEVFIPIQCALFKKKLLENYPFNDTLATWEDWFTWVSIALNGAKFRNDSNELVYFRQDKINSSSNMDTIPSQYLMASFHIASLLSGEMLERFSKLSIEQVANHYALHSIEHNKKDKKKKPNKIKYSQTNSDQPEYGHLINQVFQKEIEAADVLNMLPPPEPQIKLIENLRSTYHFFKRKLHF
ncbi:MAG: glycosyltransferase [Bacteroidetes bacterium]|nr:glycosyltransferase [Bacteroidota bacterium]